MSLDSQIIALADRYRRDARFPFKDWVTDHHSFLCLITFWDEIFKLASGSLYESYRAVQDVRQEPTSALYFVQNADATKKIRIWHGYDDQGARDIAFFWSRYPDLSKPDLTGQGYSTALEGVYMLELAVDFDPKRLCQAGVMLHEFVHVDTATHEAQSQLEASFEDRFRPHFPIPEI